MKEVKSASPSVVECLAAEPQTYLLKLLALTGSLAFQSRQMADAAARPVVHFSARLCFGSL